MGFDFRKDFGKFDVDFYVGRNTQSIDPYDGSFDNQDYMTYGLKLGYKSEKLKLGLFGRYSKFDGKDDWTYTANYDDDGKIESYDAEKLLAGSDVLNYGVYANYKLLEGLQLKGTYNHQHFDSHGYVAKATGTHSGMPCDYDEIKNLEDSDTWTAIIEADQSLLKLFALWAQYGQVGEGFIHNPAGFDQIGYNTVLTNFGGEDGFASSDYNFFKVAIHRDFTKKLRAYAMYEEFRNKGNEDISDTQNFGVGIRYQYTPAIAFQLQYDW